MLRWKTDPLIWKQKMNCSLLPDYDLFFARMMGEGQAKQNSTTGFPAL